MNTDIRLIQPKDNIAMADIVKRVLPEFGCTGSGYASGDAELEDMYTEYTKPGSQYWVVVSLETQQVLGGGGYAQLTGSQPSEKICELRKLYFLPNLRGKGLGKQCMDLIIRKAAEAGYQTMYLETVPDMKNAIKLYQKYGFDFLETHLGNTGHQHRCSVYMSRSLQASNYKSEACHHR